MNELSVFDFSSPEMSAASRKLIIRARLLSMAGLFFAFLAARLMA